LPLRDTAFRNVALAVLGFVLVFDIGTYSYYRGSVVTAFHGGPVSPTKHHLALSNATVLPNCSVRFHVYLDAGTPEAPVHVVAADLLDANNQPVAHYDASLGTAKDCFRERLRLQQVRGRSVRDPGSHGSCCDGDTTLACRWCYSPSEIHPAR
jgi:hypothetical protein